MMPDTNMNTKSSKGFTLIELLVVIAIIGILSTLAIIALSSARQKARDSKRVADLKQVSNALELYYSDNNDYPAIITTGQPIAFGSTTYMSAVPSNPVPRADNNCLNNDYTYSYVTGSYAFGTCLGSGTGSLGAGAAWASPQGVNSNRDGLVGFWKLDEGPGSLTTADSSGNNNTGTLSTSPAPTWTSSASCKYGACITFDQTNDFVSIPNSSSVNIVGKPISFGGWANLTSINPSTVMIGRLYSYILYAKDTSKSWCYLGNGSGWGPDASFTAPASGWHHIFCTYDGANIKIFIDGDLKATTAYAPSSLGSTNSIVRLGARSDSFASEMNTAVDNVRLYNIALTDAQVKALYLNDSAN